MIGLQKGITELGGDEGAREKGWPGNLGTGVSSNKGHMRLILRTPKQEPEAVSVDEETGLLPGAQRFLEFRLKILWRPEKDPELRYFLATGSGGERPGRGGLPLRTWNSLLLLKPATRKALVLECP